VAVPAEDPADVPHDPSGPGTVDVKLVLRLCRQLRDIGANLELLAASLAVSRHESARSAGGPPRTHTQQQGPGLAVLRAQVAADSASMAGRAGKDAGAFAGDRVGFAWAEGSQWRRLEAIEGSHGR
jgi:hypothetical protein